MSFQENVFINCPFDKEYQPLLKVMLYVICRVGLNPSISTLTFDSGEGRLNKIKSLICDSKYSIHDLCRATASKKNETYRLNMPFELGIDFACRDYHPEPRFKDKKMLVLEGTRYSTQKALSDMSFGDCKCHDFEPLPLIRCLREWFVQLGFRKIPAPTRLFYEYTDFYSNLVAEKSNEGYSEDDILDIPVVEFVDLIKGSLENKQNDNLNSI